ncbi:MAG: hypothetical protein XXXJIFNMEKO3_01949 [Candidatus Erwinia impunctatus]|nr:hypothetical protein XXXJIFNMEKO_01949 [Culicoides impunctatus]
MATIIWKKTTPGGTAKSRYKARRAEKRTQQQRDMMLSRKIARLSQGCSSRVQKAVLLSARHSIVENSILPRQALKQITQIHYEEFY